MTDTTADLLVLGGGIGGLTTALAAAERGLSSIILDSPKSGAASRAAAGMLAPLAEELPPAILAPAVAARDLYPNYLARLLERTGIDVALDRTGILQLAPTNDDQAAQFRAHAPPAARWLDEHALAECEPALAGHRGALHYPDDGAVDNLALMDALERAVDVETRISRVGAEILSIDVGQRSALTSTRGRYFASRLVLATGAWAATMPGLPRHLPVRPVRGQLLRLRSAPVRHVCYGAGGYLVPRGDSVLVGATSEEVGFESETSLHGLATLRSIAARFIPQLSRSIVMHHWAGLRPMSLDGQPILGAEPESPDLVYACGYSRNGILFAPWAAEQLAMLLSGTPTSALAPFDIRRPALAPVV
jgi:glycine oxidase ThiO